MNASSIESLASSSNSSKTQASNGKGNEKLSEAFEYAIKGATQTLTITTKKGADLYALKQRPQ
jgi:hypothetical protein